LKRLKYKLLNMEANTSTYTEMYEGSMSVYDPAYPGEEPYTDYSPVYYSGEVGYEITATNRQAKSRPTVVIAIPWKLIAEKPPEKWVEKAVADHCLRGFGVLLDGLNERLSNRSRNDAENGKYYIPHPGGEVICRNSAYFAVRPQKDYCNGARDSVTLYNDGVSREPCVCLCFRILVQLPAGKLRKACKMLCDELPGAVEGFVADFDRTALAGVTELAEKQKQIRLWLKNGEYCAFIANGSILPRTNDGNSPMENAVPFTSTPEDEIEVCGIKGMGVKRGVTIITGGGYSGKSTLLDAISSGVYDHVSGDGRELCITDESAVTISAEDGRSVRHVNISPFIKWLPGGDSGDFSTEHASGSTSQAANIMEAVETGAKLLLIDEDKSATNFMIRDRIMKALIEKEPITPFTDRVKELYCSRGVSTVLVIGGSGEYLSVADRVYMMEDYFIQDVTERSRELCGVCYNGELPEIAVWEQNRCLNSAGFSSYPTGSGTERLQVSDMGFVVIGDEMIDVRGLHDIVSPRQLDALGFMLRYLEVKNTEGIIDLRRKIEEIYRMIETDGLDTVYSSFFTTCERFLDLPRKNELYAMIYRMRKVRFESAMKSDDKE